MNLELTSLHLFIRVAALGAIGRAGEELGLSRTNASQRIQILEAELGVSLFNRTTRAVSLTADGERFLIHAARILDDVEAARIDLSSTSHRISGLVRVTASAAFGETHIVPFVPEFLAAYPDITLDLNLSDAIVDIVEQGYDLAYRIASLESSSLVAQKVDDDPRWLVASPDYVARHGAPVSPDDLSAHMCLPLGDIRTWSLRNSKGAVSEVRVKGPVKINMGGALHQWLLSGMGIGLAALWYVGPALKAGRLVRILPDHTPWPQTKIWAVRPPGRAMPLRVKTFMDFMNSRIQHTNTTQYGDLVGL